LSAGKKNTPSPKQKKSKKRKKEGSEQGLDAEVGNCADHDLEQAAAAKEREGRQGEAQEEE